jgi:hypothetical protein
LRNNDAFELLIPKKEILIIELDRELRCKVHSAGSVVGGRYTCEQARR